MRVRRIKELIEAVQDDVEAVDSFTYSGASKDTLHDALIHSEGAVLKLQRIEKEIRKEIAK